MAAYYPPAGFHFSVTFELPTVTDKDFRFQEVSGLTASIETQPVKEGGENRFAHQLPVRSNFEKLVLKRGMVTGSAILFWIRAAVEDFNFAPTNAIITLLNEQHVPLAAWYVVNAFPVRWSVSNFNAEQSSIVIETLELQYNYFRIIPVPGADPEAAERLAKASPLQAAF
ncbi:MAG: phage tail protein [Phaeodactylibacter sp.]|nr:phage tail protein [Phaeodactylibacter sp.]MCB0612468.1 phage tail protein [Phaeodactylibacter sp.]MCB9304588.1 phage tail protein [Lewinellaceae bacterium]